MANILICGGAGYIGSHMVRLLVEQTAHNVIVLDNLSMGHREAVPNGVSIEVGDIGDPALIRTILKKHSIDAVMHFAALLAVGDSVKDPLGYYRNNVIATHNVISAMVERGVKHFVFSSSAAVYGMPERSPISENTQKHPINPYGWTKYIVENLLSDCDTAHGLKFAALRYFNAAGAHPSGEIGEDHTPETHLIPLVLDVALGKRESISIFGDDYPTRDGSCIRDYIHVCDLASAHLIALERLLSGGESCRYNLGNGNGVSVFELVESCRRVSGRPIKAVVKPRRPGDPPSLVADSSKAQRELGWVPKFTKLDDIISTAWNWHFKHPNGYSSQ